MWPFDLEDDPRCYWKWLYRTRRPQKPRYRYRDRISSPSRSHFSPGLKLILQTQVTNLEHERFQSFSKGVYSGNRSLSSCNVLSLCVTIGPPGPPGKMGPIGSIGVKGVSGKIGKSGATGNTGASGLDYSGPSTGSGNPGLPGPRGPIGDTGPIGDKGKQV